jgi:hypothetical protein
MKQLNIKRIKQIEHDNSPALPNVGTHASSATVKGAPKARSISGVPTGVPVMTWIVQQHDQTKASITLAPDFFDIILFKIKSETNERLSTIR